MTLRSNRLFSSILALTIFALVGAASALAEVVRAERPIEGRYIVVLEDSFLRGPKDGRALGSSVGEIARSLAHQGVRPRQVFQSLPAFTIEADARTAHELARDVRIAAIYEDAVVEPAAVQEPVPSWGLDRLDQRPRPLDSSFGIWSWGLESHLYVVDSGIRSTQADFVGRIDDVYSFTAVDDGLGSEDCLGHGTRVAGIAAGTIHGIAKGATLHSARVFDCAGNGSVSGVLAAIDWVTISHRAPAVGILALQTGASEILDEAVRRSIEAGVTWVVAAGNSGGDACTSSPARVEEALTVGASTDDDNRASFSNAGSCVDLWAPGVGVVTTDPETDEGSSPFGGTSAAAPHVAGIAALWLSQNPGSSPEDVAAALLTDATPFVDGAGIPGLLAYSGFGDPATDLPPNPIFTVDCSGTRCVFDATSSYDDLDIADWSWSINLGQCQISGRNRRKVRCRIETSASGPLLVPASLTLTDSSGQTATRDAVFWVTP